jgi:hypothetical protein
MPVTVPSYTKAGLPSPGTPGDLARVSDSTRGLWMDTGAAWAPLNAETVNVREFGTGNDGAAIQAAINALPSTGGRVIVPAGTYTLTSELLINKDRVWLVGSGRNTILQAGANNITLIHWAASNGGVMGFHLDASTYTGVSGLRVTPENESQTLVRVDQNFNSFRDLFMTNCVEGVVMQAGPRVSGADSGCWYNVLADMHLLSCRRGIWLKEGPSAAQSGVNRCQFYSIRIGHIFTNTGLQIDSGGTNTFYGCSFEGIQPPPPTYQLPVPPDPPLQPNANPTAIVINAAGNSSANDHNSFFGTSWEACWRDLDCDNQYTSFIAPHALGVGHTALAPKIVGSQRPAVIITDAPSYSGFSLPGLTYSAGFLSGYVQTGWNFDVDAIVRAPNEIYDHVPAAASAGKWQAYALTTANCGNAAHIAEQHSKRQQLSGMVDWHFRMRFSATTANASVDIQLPIEPDNNLYRLYSYVPPMEFTVVTIDSTGAKKVVSAPLTDHGGPTPTRLKIPAPAAGWYTLGPGDPLLYANNTIFGMIRYKASGY